MKKTGLLIAASLLGACAYNSAPVVGPHDKTEQEYQQDLAECHEYAEKVSKEEAMKTGAVNAGVLGALSGAAAGVIDGYAVEGAVVGGVAGASAGAAGGAAKATQDQSYVLRRCLAGKGYDVLDLRS